METALISSAVELFFFFESITLKSDSIYIFSSIYMTPGLKTFDHGRCEVRQLDIEETDRSISHEFIIWILFLQSSQIMMGYR